MNKTIKKQIQQFFLKALYFGLKEDRCIFSDCWEVPSDYRATERDWYPDAFNNPDKTQISEAYVDADTGRIVVTISTGIVMAINDMDNFATNTKTTSEQCMDTADKLNEQVEIMRESINKFKI